REDHVAAPSGRDTAAARRGKVAEPGDGDRVRERGRDDGGGQERGGERRQEQALSNPHWMPPCLTGPDVRSGFYSQCRRASLPRNGVEVNSGQAAGRQR